jgi:hypothetical protein
MHSFDMFTALKRAGGDHAISPEARLNCFSELLRRDIQRPARGGQVALPTPNPPRGGLLSGCAVESAFLVGSSIGRLAGAANNRDRFRDGAAIGRRYNDREDVESFSTPALA